MLSRIIHLKVFFKDPNKKGILKMIKEIIHYGWVKKELPTDYFRKCLYRKEIINYNNYLSLNEYRKIIRSKKMVFPEIKSILHNKLSSHFYFNNLGLPIPKLISYNLKNNYFFNTKISIVNTKSDLIAFFETVFESSQETRLFLKFLDSNGGKGILLLKKENLKKIIEVNADILLNNSFMHQEVIKQHQEINKIFSKSINSLRIITYINNKNDINILSVLMRFGIGNSIVDNANAGGFFISVDMATGMLKGVGRQDFTKGARVFIKHPDTNILLENFKVPFFLDACDLAKKATKYLPNKIVGWDIAISPTGPIIIEGNHTPSLHMSDIAFGGYCNNPLIKEILNNL